MVSDYLGSDRHKRAKRQVADVLRSKGFEVYGDKDNEFAIIRPEGQGAYYLDVYAFNSKRGIVVEIDGYKGHRTKRAILKDTHRANWIKKMLRVELYRFNFSQLKDMDNDTIANEMQISCE